jgi:hypothetical protein
MSFIIAFWDKSKLQVSNEIGEKLKSAIQNETLKTFSLNGNLYAIGGVEKIIDKSDAYDIFPADNEYLRKMEDITPPENFVKLGNEKLKLL